MEKPKLIMLCGLPGTGKSTWVNTYLENNPGTVVISSDNIIDDEASRQGKTYSDVFHSVVKYATKKSWEDFSIAVSKKKDIIVDKVNGSVKGRTKYLQNTKGYHKEAIIFSLPRDVLNKRLKDRAEKTGKHIPQNVIESFIASWENPSISEGFDSVTFNR